MINILKVVVYLFLAGCIAQSISNETFNYFTVFYFSILLFVIYETLKIEEV